MRSTQNHAAKPVGILRSPSPVNSVREARRARCEAPIPATRRGASRGSARARDARRGKAAANPAEGHSRSFEFARPSHATRMLHDSGVRDGVKSSPGVSTVARRGRGVLPRCAATRTAWRVWVRRGAAGARCVRRGLHRAPLFTTAAPCQAAARATLHSLKLGRTAIARTKQQQ
jgi:hypothetical protein